MTVWPFIEAEEAEQHSVKRACELLEVSRAAYYEQRKHLPSRREFADAELMEKIYEIHTTSKASTARRGCTASYATRACMLAASALLV